MEKYTDEIINKITEHLPKHDNEWELVGFINKNKDIYTFGNDSKILGRLFEVMVVDALMSAAKDLGFKLHESTAQTVYPDFYFIKPNDRRIAIDVKTTYRKFSAGGTVGKFGFTGGSFTSFMRNGTKNIDGKYSDYDNHYIIGVLYTREIDPSTGKKPFSELTSIVPTYKEPKVFIQEKYRICGDKKGSGNTDNIGTIKAKSIESFSHGAGPFSFMGSDAFHDYWTNYPKYKDSQSIKDSLYSDISGYLNWLENVKQNKALADEYRNKYNEYLQFIKSIGWD